MATGYTHWVAEGEITTLSEFAWLCARAFGALIDQREDKMRAPIKMPHASNYHQEHIEVAQQELAALDAMTDEELEAAAAEANRHKAEYYRKSVAAHAELQQRYQSMLDQVNAWEPPTPDHDKFKEFMVSQLEESVRHDTLGLAPPQEVTGAEWAQQRRNQLLSDVHYHMREHKEEVTRVEGRRRWLLALIESVGNPPQGITE